jgi:hypothetical protein
VFSSRGVRSALHDVPTVEAAMNDALHLQERELADAMLEGIGRRPVIRRGHRGRRSSCRSAPPAKASTGSRGCRRHPPKRLDRCSIVSTTKAPLPRVREEAPADRRHHHPERPPPWSREQIAHWLRDDADARASAPRP